MPVSSVVNAGDLFTETYQVVQTSCKKLMDCDGSVVLKECIEQSYPIKTFAAPLGLPPAYNNAELAEIITDEVNEVIVPDGDNANDCRADIGVLQCTDQEVIDAYDTGLANPYENLSGMLPASCLGVFDY